MSTDEFSSLDLLPALQQNLISLDYTRMTAIQQLSLPSVLQGRDVLAQGKTGSGKTAAFALGILQKLDISRLQPQALVLCPTRELADQVSEEIRRLARRLPNVKVLSLCGGRPVAAQAESLAAGAHIVTGTPGRIEDHLARGSLKLDHIDCLVLDEADRMLDMGFLPSVENILVLLPRPVQTLLFSATYAPDIAALAEKILRDPVAARLQEQEAAPEIEQLFYRVPHADDIARTDALKCLLLHFKPQNALVFCSTRRETDEVCQALRRHGFDALALHGDMEQRERDQTLIRFSNASASVLVATDVAARGLDVSGLELVVNYQPARDEETHTHRIGRTARAGNTGRACTLLSAGDDARGAGNLWSDAPITELPPLTLLKQRPATAAMITLQIDGGKRDKIRPTDVLGALTGSGELSGADVGKIRITHNAAYVAIRREQISSAERVLASGRIKGRTARVRRLE